MKAVPIMDIDFIPSFETEQYSHKWNYKLINSRLTENFRNN